MKDTLVISLFAAACWLVALAIGARLEQAPPMDEAREGLTAVVDVKRLCLSQGGVYRIEVYRDSLKVDGRCFGGDHAEP